MDSSPLTSSGSSLCSGGPSGGSNFPSSVPHPFPLSSLNSNSGDKFSPGAVIFLEFSASRVPLDLNSSPFDACLGRLWRTTIG